MKNIFIISIAFAILASCGSKQNLNESTSENLTENTVELTDAQLKNSDIQTGKLEQQEISSILKVNGVIEVPPQNMVSISVPLGGYLKSTKLLEGMHVNKGEIIAIMEDQQYIQLQQDYLTANAHFTSIEKEYLRQKDLNQSKSSSDKVFETAQAEYIAQKVLINSLSEKLKLININPDNLNENTISRSINIPSPIDGFVTHVNMNIGKYVAPTDVLFELVNPDDIHLALTVFEKDFDKLFIGQKIIAYNNNQPNKKYECEIILIGKDLSHERAVTVHCHFEQYDKSLIPGMYMNAEVDVASHNAYAISDEGLVRFEGKQYVFIQTENKKYLMQEVTTQNSEHGFTQITFPDSTQMSDKIFVTKGAYTLLMKMKNMGEE
ncbi:MAG: efflux RND transporter periplasmic adaptor subunit [Chitinophagales bacterium]|nr:efflux RND transporter periplasmic adaptor subunit [Chitinophagales bacterium]MBP8755294.1 efflux RND transporter periplasmic adaptor subunit [Chitinophagales bacterium]MBP9189251.1 efflux RND transporter periplasmic adaptor subunit [Chitinophagales bacterium]MBP9703578.1 efflux RND transporter periplasmic adaptor subunit [Chitinophagales bacterium]